MWMCSRRWRSQVCEGARSPNAINADPAPRNRLPSKTSRALGKVRAGKEKEEKRGFPLCTVWFHQFSSQATAAKCCREGEMHQSRKCAQGLRTVRTGEWPAHPSENLADYIHRLSPRLGNRQKWEGGWGKEEVESEAKKKPETSQGKQIRFEEVTP